MIENWDRALGLTALALTPLVVLSLVLWVDYRCNKRPAGTPTSPPCKPGERWLLEYPHDGTGSRECRVSFTLRGRAIVIWRGGETEEIEFSRFERGRLVHGIDVVA